MLLSQPRWMTMKQQQQRASMLRACCCGCPATIEVVVSGVDATKCGCGIIGDNSWLISLLSVDGTYSVDFLSETTVIGTEMCNYRSCFEYDSPILRQQTFSGDVCGGVATATSERSKMTIDVQLIKSTGKVRAISIFGRLNCTDGFGFRIFVSGTIALPGADRSTPIANTLVCAFNDVAANGGTVSIT